MTARTPPYDDLWVAAEWLECYEDDEQGAACRRVAEWLREKAERAYLSEFCKESGITVAHARQAIASAKRASGAKS